MYSTDEGKVHGKWKGVWCTRKVNVGVFVSPDVTSSFLTEGVKKEYPSCWGVDLIFKGADRNTTRFKWRIFPRGVPCRVCHWWVSPNFFDRLGTEQTGIKSRFNRGIQWFTYTLWPPYVRPPGKLIRDPVIVFHYVCMSNEVSQEGWSPTRRARWRITNILLLWQGNLTYVLGYSILLTGTSTQSRACLCLCWWVFNT